MSSARLVDVFAGLEMAAFLEPRAAEDTVAALLELPESQLAADQTVGPTRPCRSGSMLQTATAIYHALGRVYGNDGAAATFKAKCRALFPLSSVFDERPAPVIVPEAAPPAPEQ